MPQGLKVWRSKRAGKAHGTFRASWKNESGRRITWDTKSLDEAEALGKGVAEVNRRRSAAFVPSASDTVDGSPRQRIGTQPAATSGLPPAASPPDAWPPLPHSNGTNANGRRPIGDAIAQALSSSSNSAAAADVRADAAIEARAKAKKLHEVFGKAMAYITAGALQRACRFAGREPEDMDEDEEQLVREGWEEKGADWFGRSDIGPWGKIALGSAVAGVGMYMGGKPLPPKPPEPPARELPPPETERR